jgi:hypothetical protein
VERDLTIFFRGVLIGMAWSLSTMLVLAALRG